MTYLLLFLLPMVDTYGNQLGLCHYLRLIGKQNPRCGHKPLAEEPPEPLPSLSNNPYGVFEPIRRHYGTPVSGFSTFNPDVKIKNRRVSIEKYRQLLLGKKPRHSKALPIIKPIMKSPKPIFPYFRTTTPSYIVDLEPVSLRALGSCRARFSSCKPHSACSSSVMCRDTEGICCRPSHTHFLDATPLTAVSCPAPDILTPQCNKKLGVSWCDKDIDCHTPVTKRKCCPTACNYNICV